MIDELLGMLEPSTVKLGMGRGGIPTLTAQDIDIALADCPDKFAAMMYLAASGGSMCNWAEIDRLLAAAQFAEWRNRADRMLTAQLLKAEANVSGAASGDETHIRADMMLAGARAAMWPALIEETYAAMRKALIAELRSSRACPTCTGRSFVMAEAKMQQCVECLGSGRVHVSDRQRAEMIGMDHSSYRRSGWKKAYEWMYRMLIDAIALGRAQFAEAMERGVESRP